MPLDTRSSRAIRELWRNVRTILIVVASAAVALLLLVFLANAQRRSREVYAVDDGLLNALPANGETAEAVRSAIAAVRPRKPHIENRDALLAALMPEVMGAANFPKAQAVIAEAKKGLEAKEGEIHAQRQVMKKKQSSTADAQVAVIQAQRRLSDAEAAFAEFAPEQQRLDAAKAKLDNALVEAKLASGPASAAAQERVAQANAELAIRNGGAARLVQAKEGVDVARRSLADAFARAAAVSGELNDATLELDGLIREHNYAADHLNLALASLRDQQMHVANEATNMIEVAVAQKKDDLKKKQTSEPSLQLDPLINDATTPESPYHVLYQAFFLVCMVVVVLAITFCAATLLKVLPYPGSAEKWSDKIEALAEKAGGEGGGGKSQVASLLLTATTFGIGVVAAGHVLREPGGFFHDAASTVSLVSAEAPLTSTSGSSTIISSASLTLPPYPTLNSTQNPTFTFSPVITAPSPPIAISTVNQIPPINVPPSQINGLEQLKEGVAQIGEQARATNETARAMVDAFNTEKTKAEALKAVVEKTGRAFETVAGVIDANDLVTRLTVGDIAKEDGERQLLFARQETVNATRRWWRSLLVLSRYQVTSATRTLFETEPSCSDKYHENLRRALKEIENADPQYEAPFETTIIQHMIGTHDLGDARFHEVRAEVRRHLPVILQASRIAQ